MFVFSLQPTRQLFWALATGLWWFGYLNRKVGALYGWRPTKSVSSAPVCLDVGTDRKSLTDDPLYVRARHPRLRGDDHKAFLDAFVDAVRKRWPKAIISGKTSRRILHLMFWPLRDKVPSFNDDIQGTGAVALAGVLRACELKEETLADSAS